MSDLATSGPMLAAAITTTGAISVAAATLWHHQRRDRSADQRALKRESALALKDALHRVRDVVDTSGKTEVHPRRVSEVLASWKTTFETHRHRLPRDADHIDHSLGAAYGEHCGLVGQSHRIEDGADYPLADLDHEWWDYGVGYTDHVLAWLKDWHDDPARAERHPPLRFDPWLDAVRRHRDDVLHGRISKWESLAHRWFGADK